MPYHAEKAGQDWRYCEVWGSDLKVYRSRRSFGHHALRSFDACRESAIPDREVHAATASTTPAIGPCSLSATVMISTPPSSPANPRTRKTILIQPGVNPGSGFWPTGRQKMSLETGIDLRAAQHRSGESTIELRGSDSLLPTSWPPCKSSRLDQESGQTARVVHAPACRHFFGGTGLVGTSRFPHVRSSRFPSGE